MLPLLCKPFTSIISPDCFQDTDDVLVKKRWRLAIDCRMMSSQYRVYTQEQGLLGLPTHTFRIIWLYKFKIILQKNVLVTNNYSATRRENKETSRAVVACMYVTSFPDRADTSFIKTAVNGYSSCGVESLTGTTSNVNVLCMLACHGSIRILLFLNLVDDRHFTVRSSSCKQNSQHL